MRLVKLIRYLLACYREQGGAIENTPLAVLERRVRPQLMEDIHG